jgi:hypothetical protein
MNTPTHASEQSLRIGAEELRTRLGSGETATLLDVRNDKPWEKSSVKIAGAIRVRRLTGTSTPPGRKTA